MSDIKKGVYRHYKGHNYQVLNEAIDSEDKRDLVVYKRIGADHKIWVRPKQMFLEEVEVDGAKKPRFELIAEGDESSFEDKYKRALADYQNLLKKVAQEKQEFIKYAASELLEEILPVYDYLKLSLRDLPAAETDSAWVQGVKYVLKQFQDILTSHGVAEIKTVGEKFNHNTMEALEGQGDKVIKEIMSGYTLNGRLLRAAKVVVG